MQFIFVFRFAGLWKDIVKFAHHNHTLYVTRESQRFLNALLLEESQSAETCREIISAIAEPLVRATLNGQTQSSLEDLYTHQNKHLCNALNLITSILENTLFVSLDNTIPDMFENLTNLESRVRALFVACVSTQFFQHIHKLWILVNVRLLKQGLSKESDVVQDEAWERFREGLCFAQTLLLAKKDIIELGNTHKMSLIYWTRLQAIHKFALPMEHKFEHQVITLLVS